MSSSRSGRASSGRLYQAALVSSRSAAWGSPAARLTFNSSRSALACCLPARLPARAAPPCRTCAEPHPQARKDVPPAGLNHPGGLDQLAGVQGPFLPSCSLVATGLKEEVEKGKVKCLARRPCRQSREGRPNPELPLASFTIPIPARPGAPWCWVPHRCGLRHEENVLFGGCHIQLRAPARICAVPSDVHTRSALRTLTIDTAQHSRTLLGTGQGAQLTAKRSPPPWGGPLHAASNHPPLCTSLPGRGRLAPSLWVGTDQSVVFVEAERNGDINIKSDFSLSDALSVSMGTGKDTLTSPTRPGCPHTCGQRCLA